MPTNKHERELAKKNKLRRRALALGHTIPFEGLPVVTQRALANTGFDSKRSQSKGRERKAFHKDKSNYGHFSGRNAKFDPRGRRGLTERDLLRNANNEVE